MKSQYLKTIATRPTFNVNEPLLIIRSSGTISWSWGMHNVTNYGNKSLVFKVQGFVHNGLVAIHYNEGRELYMIDFLNNHYKVVKTVEDVYFDDLVEILDRNIEKDVSDSEYAKLVSQVGL